MFAAANPAAAMLTCAAVATRNEDGSCGSSPVSVTASSAARSPPANAQRSASISQGVCMGDSLGDVTTLSLPSSSAKAALASLGGTERRSNPHFALPLWIASRNLLSGARSRDPLARNDSCLMKIPRGRQDAHVARMADFLGWIVRVLTPVIMQRFDQRR